MPASIFATMDAPSASKTKTVFLTSTSLRRYAAEFVALGPDVLVGGFGSTAPILQQATHTVPIVVAQSVNPVGGGFVNSMAGGHLTGFIQFEYGLAGKWLELLKDNKLREFLTNPFGGEQKVRALLCAIENRPVSDAEFARGLFCFQVASYFLARTRYHGAHRGPVTA